MGPGQVSVPSFSYLVPAASRLDSNINYPLSSAAWPVGTTRRELR